jgi:hypothetical protein
VERPIRHRRGGTENRPWPTSISVDRHAGAMLSPRDPEDQGLLHRRVAASGAPHLIPFHPDPAHRHEASDQRRVSAAFIPRTAERILLPRMSASISPASASLSDAGRKVTSPGIPVNIPPSPNITRGPNWGSRIPGGQIADGRLDLPFTVFSDELFLQPVFASSFRSSRRRIFPTALLGRASRNAICRGTLYRASRSLA